MAISITPRWGGPTGATAASTYKVERSYDLASWSTLAASQAATTPYVSPSTTLSSQAAYGATTITLTSATGFSTAGYAWLDGEALIQWTGKSSNDLTGVTWHSGYGTYATLSTVVEAHESYADTATPTNNAVVYRVTHTNGDGVASAPTYMWYYNPPVPESSSHCVVVVVAAEDVGYSRKEGVSVTCTMATDDQFEGSAGAHLDKATNTELTNALGLAFFHCWKNSARASLAGTDAAYSFSVSGLSVTAATIPDRDWVLLSQIGA